MTVECSAKQERPCHQNLNRRVTCDYASWNSVRIFACNRTFFPDQFTCFSSFIGLLIEWIAVFFFHYITAQA